MRKLPPIRRIPNDLWMEIAPILGKEKEPGTKGRRAPAPFRMVLDGILYVLRTECHWKKMLPSEYGSGSTCHRRFQQWVREGVFEKIWIKLLKIYDDIRGIKWKWQSLDSSSVRSPLGGTRRVKTPLIVRS
jgi:transposase